MCARVEEGAGVNLEQFQTGSIHIGYRLEATVIRMCAGQGAVVLPVFSARSTKYPCVVAGWSYIHARGDFRAAEGSCWATVVVYSVRA